MRSSSGEYYVALDHIRALAALMVFSWHFIHAGNGFPVPFEGAPWAPFALFDEGHAGVALFMTLSGYLFAKLVDGKRVSWIAFLWNRFLRLAPLLLVVMTIQFFMQTPDITWRAAGLHTYHAIRGLVYPIWPNGGWSVTVELHFYLLLPLLLWLRARSTLWLLAVISLAMLGRWIWYLQTGTIQWITYHTIFGRIDQFVWGLLAYHARASFGRKHLQAAALAGALMAFYWWFDSAGGFYQYRKDASLESVWIVLPTIEGMLFAGLIAWYDNSFTASRRLISRLGARLGEYSYSIYLLHFFFVFTLAKWLHDNVVDLSNIYLAIGMSVVVFCALIPVGYLSMALVERPFLAWRRRYLIEPSR